MHCPECHRNMKLDWIPSNEISEEDYKAIQKENGDDEPLPPTVIGHICECGAKYPVISSTK